MGAGAMAGRELARSLGSHGIDQQIIPYDEKVVPKPIVTRRRIADLFYRHFEGRAHTAFPNPSHPQDCDVFSRLQYVADCISLGIVHLDDRASEDHIGFVERLTHSDWGARHRGSETRQDKNQGRNKQFRSHDCFIITPLVRLDPCLALLMAWRKFSGKELSMKFPRGLRASSFLVLVAAMSMSAVDSQTVTVKGFVLDSACAFTKGISKPVSKQCAKDCAKGGSPLVILADNGDIYWPVTETMPATGQNAKLLPFAGEFVTATGKMYQRRGSKAIAIEKIEKQPAGNHK